MVISDREEKVTLVSPMHLLWKPMSGRLGFVSVAITLPQGREDKTPHILVGWWRRRLGEGRDGLLVPRFCQQMQLHVDKDPLVRKNSLNPAESNWHFLNPMQLRAVNKPLIFPAPLFFTCTVKAALSLPSCPSLMHCFGKSEPGRRFLVAGACNTLCW